MSAEEGRTIAEIASALRQQGARFAGLLALCQAAAAGHDLDEAVGPLAGALGRDPAELRGLANWVESLRGQTPGEKKLNVCVSVSCAGHGAGRLHQALLPLIESLPGAPEIRRVHCLDQCESGPSLGCGNRIYVGRSETIIEDERSWRREPFIEKAE